MNNVFADTSFYIALVNPRDVDHQRAVDFRNGYRGAYVTTEFVLVELGNWLSGSGMRLIFIELVKRLAATPEQILFRSTVNGLKEDWTCMCGALTKRGQ